MTSAAPAVADIALLESETLAIARDLIRIESVNTGDPATIGDGEARAARLIQGLLGEVGYTTAYAESTPGRGNLVARLAGADRDRGALIAHAHLDVVPAEAADWTHPPFAAEIHDGSLHGRGALDMKSHAAALVAIARAFRREGIVPERDLIFAFFADEEAGGVWGVRWLIEHRPEWFAGATEAVSEVGGFSVPFGARRGYLVATAEKGVGRLGVTARGTAGHGSRPTADNAVTRVARAVAAIGGHRFPVEPTSAVESFARRVSELLGEPLTADDLPGALDRLGVAGPLVAAGLRNTVSPTVIAGGYKANVIPGEASAQFDIRVLPGAEERLRAEVEALAGDDVELRWDRWIPPIEAPAEGPLLDVFAAAVAAEDPDGVLVPFLMPASTDNKHLARIGVTGYGFVPLRTSADFDAFGHFHAVDERIPLDALAFSVRTTARILRRA